MSTKRYPPEFKDEAVRQVVDRGYSVAEVAEHLSVSAHSLHKWVKAAKPDPSQHQATDLVEAKSEILKLRAQLRRVEEERDNLKNHLVTLSPTCSRSNSVHWVSFSYSVLGRRDRLLIGGLFPR